MGSKDYDIWVEVTHEYSDWCTLKNILIEAFKSDHWFRTIYPEEKEFNEKLSWEFEQRYNHGIKNGRGALAVVKERTDGGVEIIGGICISYQGKYREFKTVADDMDVDERKLRLRDQLIRQPLEKVVKEYGTQLWTSYMQAVKPGHQSKSIGTKYFPKGCKMIIYERLKQMREEGTVLRCPPLVYGLTLNTHVLNFIQRQPVYSTSSSIDLDLHPYGIHKCYVSFLHIDGNENVIKAAQRMFVKSKL